jgi:hypothetical protein
MRSENGFRMPARRKTAGGRYTSVLTITGGRGSEFFTTGSTEKTRFDRVQGAQ